MEGPAVSDETQAALTLAALEAGAELARGQLENWDEIMVAGRAIYDQVQASHRDHFNDAQIGAFVYFGLLGAGLPADVCPLIAWEVLK